MRQLLPGFLWQRSGGCEYGVTLFYLGSPLQWRCGQIYSDLMNCVRKTGLALAPWIAGISPSVEVWGAPE